jgi:hypothetical protein
MRPQPRDNYPIEPLTYGIKPLGRPTDRFDNPFTALEDGTESSESVPGDVTNVTFPFQGMTQETFESITGWNNIVSC